MLDTLDSLPYAPKMNTLVVLILALEVQLNKKLKRGISMSMLKTFVASLALSMTMNTFARPSYDSDVDYQPKPSPLLRQAIFARQQVNLMQELLEIPSIHYNGRTNLPIELRRLAAETPKVVQGIRVLIEENQSLKDELAQNPPQVDFFSDSGKILYIGCDNKVTFSATQSGQLLNTILSSPTANLGIEKTSDDSFIIRPISPVQVTINRSVIMADGSETDLSDYNFLAIRLPSPNAYFGSVTAQGQMTKAEFLNINFLTARPDSNVNEVCRHSFTLVSFNVLINNGATNREFVASSPAITSDMRAEFGNLRPGSKVTFYNINVNVPDGSQRKISPIVISVR